MNFNRNIFFSKYREVFGAVKQEQVDGLNSLLHNFETYYGWWDNLDQIANALAQIKHETAHSFQPVVEAYYLGDPDKPHYYQGNTERVNRVQHGFKYFPYFGMGYIQLTWEENFRKLDRLIRQYFAPMVQQFELRTGEKLDLAAKPKQVLDPDISFAVMTIGMHQGAFRKGHTLDRYINAHEVDHFAAREIVNGDKNYRIKGSSEKIGERIASEAKKFTKILRWALVSETESATANANDGASGPAAVETTTNNQSDPQEALQSLPAKNSEVIVNTGEAATAPPQEFVPENKVMEAPPKDGATATTAQSTILGIGVPAGVYAVFKGAQEWVEKGYIDMKAVLDTVIELIRNNVKYVSIVLILIAGVVVVKKVFKQITFIAQMFINANPNWHNITIVPSTVERKKWYQFWK